MMAIGNRIAHGIGHFQDAFWSCVISKAPRSVSSLSGFFTRRGSRPMSVAQFMRRFHCKALEAWADEQ
jgi:hypothetical protein